MNWKVDWKKEERAHIIEIHQANSIHRHVMGIGKIQFSSSPQQRIASEISIQRTLSEIIVFTSMSSIPAHLIDLTCVRSRKVVVEIFRSLLAIQTFPWTRRKSSYTKIHRTLTASSHSGCSGGEDMLEWAEDGWGKSESLSETYTRNHIKHSPICMIYSVKESQAVGKQRR